MAPRCPKRCSDQAGSAVVGSMWLDVARCGKLIEYSEVFGNATDEDALLQMSEIAFSLDLTRSNLDLFLHSSSLGSSEQFPECVSELPQTKGMIYCDLQFAKRNPGEKQICDLLY